MTTTRLNFKRSTRPAGLRNAYWESADRGIVLHVASVYDGIAAALDTDGGRWQAVCEEHGHVSSHLTLDNARYFAQHRDEWCEDCMARAVRD